MSKGPSSFRVTDVRRAIQTTESAGLKVARIELSPGTITIIPGDGKAGPPGGPSSK